MKAINILVAAAILFGTVSCNRKYDEPPVKKIPVGNILTITDVKAIYDSLGTYTFTEDYSFYATATTDETSGNFYKEVYVQDGSSAIQLRLNFSGGLYEGDSVRVALKGTTIDRYKGMFQLSNVDVDDNVIKQATEKHVTPIVLTIPQISVDLLKYQGMLVQIDDVEFDINDVCGGATWSDAVGQSDVNHTILDCNNSPLIVRTSGYANFASEALPIGKGSLIAVIGVYSSDNTLTSDEAQLYIREPGELTMTGTRCSGSFNCPYLLKTFDDGSLVSGGWSTQLVTGSLNWTIGTFGGKSYANMSNYNGSSNEINESWLISPSIDLSGSTTPSFSFENAYSYTGNPLDVLVSTNYDGTSAPNTATWTSLASGASWSSGFFAWVNSGNINMGAYKQAGVYVAFKYIGSGTDGSTWEVDNIKIEEL